MCLCRVRWSCVHEGSEERVCPCWVLGCALHLSWVLRGLCTCVSYGLCVMLVLRGVCLGYVEGLLPRWLLRVVSVRVGSECRVGSRWVLRAVCTCGCEACFVIVGFQGCTCRFWFCVGSEECVFLSRVLEGVYAHFCSGGCAPGSKGGCVRVGSRVSE